MNEKHVAGFWARVDRKGDDECWLWKGAVHNRKGYGYMRVMGRNLLAHRMAYVISSGSLPDLSLKVCHRCDVPACCNPKHLFLGTYAENNRDRHNKGRTVIGEGNGKAKLDEARVLEIRERAAASESTADLAAEFGVARRTVQYIVSGKRQWAHVPTRRKAR